MPPVIFVGSWIALVAGAVALFEIVAPNTFWAGFFLSLNLLDDVKLFIKHAYLSLLHAVHGCHAWCVRCGVKHLDWSACRWERNGPHNH